MSNIKISGYSGINDGNTVQTGGGAMRIRSANWTPSIKTTWNVAGTSASPTLVNVTVENCCRGFRLQDCTGVYVKSCDCTDIDDNALYFASSTYNVTTYDSEGCKDCTFDLCVVNDAGQCGVNTIGCRDGCVVKNCTIKNARGAAVMIFHFGRTNGEGKANSLILLRNSFVDVNDDVHTKTPWGSIDNGDGAAVAFTGGSGIVHVFRIFFKSGSGATFFLHSSTTGSFNIDTNNVWFPFSWLAKLSPNSTNIPNLTLSNGSPSASGDPYIFHLFG